MKISKYIVYESVQQMKYSLFISKKIVRLILHLLEFMFLFLTITFKYNIEWYTNTRKIFYSLINLKEEFKQLQLTN